MKETLKIITVLFSILMLATIVTPVFADTMPAISVAPRDSKLIEDITWTGVNSFDGGNVGWWALDCFTEHDQVYQASTGTYYFFATGSGTWTTYATALSPNKGAPEPKDGSGTYSYQEFTSFTATAFNPTYKTSGFVGTFNYEGTKAIVLLGTYSKQLAAWTGTIPFDPIANYFTYNTNTINEINGNFLGSYTYVYQDSAPWHSEIMQEYIIGNLPVVMVGDIVT